MSFNLVLKFAHKHLYYQELSRNLRSVPVIWKKESITLSFPFQVVEEVPVSKSKRLGLFHKS